MMFCGQDQDGLKRKGKIESLNPEIKPNKKKKLSIVTMIGI